VTTEQCKRHGFDLSRTEDGRIVLRCSQCEACFINGVPCHETGCPNRKKERPI